MASYSRKRKYRGGYSASSAKHGRYGVGRRGRVRRGRRRVFRRFARKRKGYSGRRRVRFRRRYRRKSLVEYITIRCSYETDCVMEYDQAYPVGKTFGMSCDRSGGWWPLNDRGEVLNTAKWNMYRQQKLLRAMFSFSN